MLLMRHNAVMDVVQVLQELARHPLPDEAFAQAARALVLSGTTSSASSAAAPVGPAPLPAPGQARAAPEVAAAASTSEAPREDRNVRFTVFDGGGHRTTMSLPREFRDFAAQRLGGEKKLSALVRQFARMAPLGTANRSGWVQERIQQRLQESRDTRTPDLFETDRRV